MFGPKPKFDSRCNEWFWERSGSGVYPYSHVLPDYIWDKLSDNQRYIYFADGNSLRKYYNKKMEAIKDYEKIAKGDI